LEIGSSKSCCLIAEIAKRRQGGDGDDCDLDIKGIGYHASQGVKNGVIVDMVAAERAIRAAVDAAERMARTTIDDVYVNVSGGRPSCTLHSGRVKIDGGPVCEDDLAQALERARAQADFGGRALLHFSPVAWGLDQTGGISHPLGMFGRELSVEASAVVVEPGPLHNLVNCVERCHLSVEGLVISPYASARAVLVADELELGVTCIDMGGGTTSIAVFLDGKLAFADTIPVGGQHVTNDIARGLSTPTAHAERLKTLHGSALPGVCDERDFLPVPLVGERGTDTVNRVPKSVLTSIIRPRLEETFELVADRLKASGLATQAGRRAVLTGGACQLTGAREFAGRILDRQIRLGVPRDLVQLSGPARGPQVSVAAGLLDCAARGDSEPVTLPHATAGARGRGYFARVGRWIRESF